MRSKHLLIILTVCLVLALGVFFVACDKGGGTVEKGGENAENLSKAVSSIYESLKNNRTISGAELLYVGFDGSIKNDDSEGESEYATLFDFDAKIYVGEDEGTSTLAFKVKKDTTAVSLFEMYYNDDTLYVNYPPVFQRAAIKGFDIETLTKKLVESGNSSSGKWRTTMDLLPTFAEYVLTDCTKFIDGSSRTYTFKVDISRFLNALDSFLSSADLGVTRQQVLNILGKTAQDITFAAQNGEAKLEVHTTVTSGIESFKDATYTYTEGTKTKTVVLNSFRADAVTSINQNDYPVTLADNLNNYKPFDIKNLAISGTASLNLTSTNGEATFLNDPLTLALQMSSYECRYDFISSMKDDYSAYLNLSGINGTEKDMQLYYDGNLYVNASSYLNGASKLKLDGSWLKDSFKALNVLVDRQELSVKEKLYFIANLMASRTVNGSRITYTLDKDVLDLLFKSQGYDSVLDYTSVKVELNTDSGAFKGLDITFNLKGASLKFSSDYPTFGYTVETIRPEWIDESVDLASQKIITPVLKGDITTNVPYVSNTQLVSSLIYSMSGKNVELSGEIKSFELKANLSPSGALSVYEIDFLDAKRSLVCTLYYNLASSDLFFVIMPQQNGVSHVETLSLLSESRFGEFAHRINGNVAIEDAPFAFTIGNTQREFIFELNQEGANGMLAKLKKVFTEMRVLSVPIELGVEKFTLTVKEETTLRTLYGNSRYIDLKFTDIELGFNDLSVATRQIDSHGDQVVSIYQDNDMPETISVTLGKGNDARALTVSVDDFGGWNYVDLPDASRTQGVKEIVAYVNVFGQRVTDVLNVDYSDLGNVEVEYNYNGKDFETIDVGVDKNAEYMSYLQTVSTEAGDVDGFVFPRYNGTVDPILLINNKFNLVVVNGMQKDIYWINRNEKLNENSFTKVGDAEKDSFQLTPVLQDFFGADIRLSKNYVIMLEGARIREVKNADDFLTISAYQGLDPLSPATYLAAHTEFNLMSDAGTITLADLVWDVSTIRNVNISGVASKEALMELLDEKLYSVDGKFRISVTYANALHSQESKDVTVTVIPREIASVNVNSLSQGVERFIQNTQRQHSESFGLFVLDPFTVKTLFAEMQISKSIDCYFKNSANEYTTVNTIKWQVPDFNGVKLTSEQNLTGTLSAVIGNDISGYQNLTFDYMFINYPITAVSLTNNGVVVTSGEIANEMQFELLSLDPYAYVYPKDVSFAYGGIAYEYRGVSYQIPSGVRTISDVEWSMNGFNVNKIWQYDESVVYQGSTSITDVEISLKMSFVGKVLEKDKWEFLDKNGNVFATSSLPVATPQTYVLDENGNYYKVNNRYVYSEEKLDGDSYSPVVGVYSDVYYKKPNDKDVKRLIIDPTKTDYLCLDSYPEKVRVTFTDGTTEDLDALWDFTNLERSLDISQKGFFRTIGLFIAGGQKVADVSMWIAATRPDAYYVKPAFIGDELDAENSSNHLYLSILSVDQEYLAVKDIRELNALHDLICDCNDKDCLGKVYFSYVDTNIESKFFDVTEWIGLEKIKQLFDTQLAEGVAIQDVSGDLTLTAKVGDTECLITLTIEKSVMSNPELSGLPYASSSIYGATTGKYSMNASGTTLTIDPYLASPLDGKYYPTTIDFSYKGVSTKAIISSWDYSAFNGIDLYNGATKEVYALIDTPYGVAISIPVQATLLSRKIEKVYVDNSDVKRIFVDGYAKNSFGENYTQENGRTFALKSVVVKFAGDDNLYPLTLKYDITDYTASYGGNLIAQDVTVYVGSQAGGYQAVNGYTILNANNTILSIISEDSNVTSVVTDGKVYTETVDSRQFYEFGDGDEDNLAWESLTVLAQSIKVECGYYLDELGNKNSTILTAEAYQEGKQGLVYSWTRQLVDGKNYLYFNLWYQNDDLGDKLGQVQSICTYSEKYVKLTGSSFSLAALENLDKTYQVGYTLQDLFSQYNIINTHAFGFDDLIITVTDDKGRSYQMDSELNAGVYTLVLKVDDARYSGEITVNFTVKKLTVTGTEIKLNNRSLSKTALDTKTMTSYYGTTVNVQATCQETALIVVITKDDQQIVPTEVGVYKVSFVPENDNYQDELGDFTLEIIPVEEE